MFILAGAIKLSMHALQWYITLPKLQLAQQKISLIHSPICKA